MYVYLLWKAVWNLFENSLFSCFWAKYSEGICLFLKIVLHCNGFYFSLRLLYWWNMESLSFAAKKTALFLLICEEKFFSEPRISQKVRLGKMRLTSPSCIYISGVRDPDFGVESGRIFGFWLDIVFLSTGLSKWKKSALTISLLSLKRLFFWWGMLFI